MNDSNSLKVTQYLTPNYWPMWLLFGIMRVSVYLPLRWIEIIGTGFGMLMYISLPSRRRIARKNIKQAFKDYSNNEIKQLLVKSYKSLGISLFEVGLAWWGDREKLKKVFTVTGMEHLENAMKEAKGVILLSGHFTTLEIGGNLLALKIPFQVVYKTAHNPLFDAFMYHYRAKVFTNVIANKNAMEFVKGLRNGLVTWYGPDQDFNKEDIEFTPFLGGIASTLTSTARLAKISGAAVVPYYPKRKPDGQGYELVILEKLKDFPGGDAYNDAAAVNRVIESMVYANPEQYAWVHKRFKTRPRGEKAFY